MIYAVSGGRRKGPPGVGLFCVVVRRRPTLPHRPRCSTIGAGGLSFRVRNGSGRFPAAMAAVTLCNCQHLVWVFVVWELHSGRGGFCCEVLGLLVPVG